MRKFIFLFIVVSFYCFTSPQAQPRTAGGTISYPYQVDTLQSERLNEKRVIKIFLPEGFQKVNQYPFLFTLDESWMFEPTVSTVKQLMDFHLIPPVIVIGINSPNRSRDLRLGSDGQFTPSSEKFYQYISTELVEYLSAHISIPSFLVLTGHSDGAVFSQKVLTRPEQPFRGVISLSIQLAPGQFKEISAFAGRQFSQPVYHFVGSATRDATYRYRSGLKLDSLFRTVHNPGLALQATTYAADHSGVAARGLNDGIAFIFKDYVQENDWNQPLIDSLKKANADPVMVIRETLDRIKAIYGVDAKPLESGILSLASAICDNKEKLSRYIAYDTLLHGKNKDYYSYNAQRYEHINEYPLALANWRLNLEQGTDYGNFFYYYRPINLLVSKMKNPQEAVAFAEEWLARKPDFALLFHYYIAKICTDHQLSRKKARSAIQYCLDHFAPNEYFKLEEIKKMSDGIAVKAK